MPDADIAVIGAGAAGLAVASGAAQFGQRVVLVERDRMGGNGLNTALVPSKALLAAVRKGADWDAARAHLRNVAAAIAPMASEERYRGLGVTVLKGEARFVDPDAIQVDGRHITTRRFVVATGSRPSVPPIEGLAEVPYWTNESLFSLPDRPDHLLILGGNSPGLEMADAFAGLGCRVTLIEAWRIAGQDDPELAAGLRMALVRRGVVILEQAKVVKVLAGPILVLEDGRRIEGSHLLVATGRHPDLDTLDLTAGGIKASPAGILTDTGLRSVTNRRVFAVGDIADPVGLGPRASTHVAGYHAGIVLRRMLFRLPARLNYAAVPRVIYTDPELAQTGLTQAQAVAAGLKPRVLRWPLADNDRAIAEGATEGLVKLVVSGKRVVGAGILAPGAGDMISLWSLAIAQRIPIAALAGLIVPYPTRSEAGKRAAGSLFASTLFSERTRGLVRLLSRLP
jgi:pyruvate/2-oxoglutarate dehydrogenase complex dihydrolipoamide dehydrogenase (E3) component